MKKMIVSTAAFAVVAFSAVALAPTNALANSAFARQTGQACHACHFQSIPRLNAFGRNFRINGFRDTGTQGLIEDEGLSLPASFNAGLNMALGISQGDTETTSSGVTTTHYGAGLLMLPKTLGTATTSTGLAWPVEAELVIGGRYGDNFGGVASIDLAKSDRGHGLGVTPEPGLAHYKLAFVYDTEMGPVAIAGGSTEDRGAAYLFNDPSNVFGQNVAGWQHQAAFLGIDNEHAVLTGEGINAGSVTGLGIYTHLNGMGYLAIGGIVPAAINDGLPVNFKISPYVRAAFTGAVAGFDVVAGGWYYANKLGDYNTALVNAAAGTAITNQTATQYGLDLQVQGNLPGTGATVGFYLPWQIKGESISEASVTTDEDWTGVYPMLTIGINAPVNAGLRFGYDYTEIETKGTTLPKIKGKTWVIGAWLDVAQNVVVDIEYNNSTHDNFNVSTGVIATTESSDADTFTAVVEYVY